MEDNMSKGTSKPSRATKLAAALVAITGIVAGLTAYASAQTSDSRYYSGVITGPDFCINDSLGGPRTYPFDSPPQDGIADTCSLPTTRRATVARQGALELLALDFPARFGQLFAYECVGVAKSYGNPAKESEDECVQPKSADATGEAIPPVPASRVSPNLATTWQSSFFSGPVINNSTFCLNRSLGGPVTYPLDTNGDNVADICSLPTTRRATIARQNALERLARERNALFESLFSSECARLIDTSFGEKAAEDKDECADLESETGQPLPGDDDDETEGGNTNDNGNGGSGGNQQSNRPSQSVSSPSATNPGTYSKRAAQDLLLAPGANSIVASWNPVTADAGNSEYDADEVTDYVVQYSTNRSMSNSKQLVLNVDRPDGSVSSNQPDRCAEASPAHSKYQCTISQLRQNTTYYVRVLANRGNPNTTGSGNSRSRDYWTPTLSITTGIAGPPRWADGDSDTDGVQPLVSKAYGEMTAHWDHPVEGSSSILNYTIQWGTSRSFANNCDTSSNCEQERVASTETDYTIPGLTNNRTYYVRIQGTTANGPGTWSLTESFRLASNLKNPGKPRNVQLTTVSPGTSLQVMWEAPRINDNDPAATGYRVQWRNVDDSENWSASRRQSTAAVADPPTHTITGLNALDRYQVRVLAVNDRVAGPWSDTEEITLGVAGAPHSISIVPRRNGITVSWTNPMSSPAATSIILQWDTNRSFASNCAADASCTERILAAGDDQEPITGLTAGTVYYVRLQSRNGNGPGEWSETHSSEPGTLIAPSEPSATEDTDNIRSANLEWTLTRETGKPDVTEFSIRWRQSGTTSWRTDSSITLTEANCPSTDDDYPYCSGYDYTLPNLTTGVEHEIQIQAENRYGPGPWSESKTVTPGASFIPSIGDIVAGSDSSSRATIQVTWSAPSSSLAVTNYLVQWRSCGSSGYSCGSWGSSQTVADTGSLESFFPATSLRDGIYYQARVRANGTSSSGGNGAYDESARFPVKIDDNDTPNDRMDDSITFGDSIAS